jgi:ferredoxin
MSKNIIFYFSGTGNSLKAAKDIAVNIPNCELVSIAKPQKLQGTYERIGFVYPVYCGGMPLIVERFIKDLDLSANKQSYIFAICTSGAMSGGMPQVNKLLLGKGCKLSYGNNIKCFANYICMYDMTKDVEGKTKTQTDATKPIILDIQNLTIKQNFKNGVMGLIHGSFVKSLANKDKGYNVNKNCVSCGTCSKVCPVSNIEMQDGKPTFLNHCEQCVACIQWCPKQAINFKNKTQARGRYHHPDIKLKDMINEI